jgi:hypothetical protein
VGRDAIAFRFVSYDERDVIFVDTTTHDFLGLRTSTLQPPYTQLLIVEMAGVFDSVGKPPSGDQLSVRSA